LLTDPIITLSDVDGMVEEVKCVLPTQWRLLQEILGYDTVFKKRSKTEVVITKEHLLKLYNRMTLYKIMALSCACNPHNFIYWACIAAAVMYGQSNFDVSHYIPTFFGFSTSLTTLATRTAEMSKLTLYHAKVKLALTTQLIQWRDDYDVDHASFVFLACYDNSQKNSEFKFQHDGKTSNFVKVTAQMFVQLWQGAWQHTPLANCHVTIKYIRQTIPLPLGMSPFELAKVPTELLLSGNPLKHWCVDMSELYPLAPTVDFRGNESMSL
jgi:hypothetical protein